jgi:putative tricarboxylic transport membrane protein
MLRGTGIGFLLGLLPGPGTTLSTFASYNVERRVSKHPETFGHGAIQGVAGPESANNAAVTAHMIPLMALGLPFSPAMALLFAGLLLQGIQPGPLMMAQRPEVFWGLIASMYIGNVALLVLNFPLVGLWVSFLRIPQPILVAFIVIFMLIGAYSINNNVLDMVVLLVMGVFGYVMRKLRFDAVPIILALVLGPLLERTFRQSLYLSRGDPFIFFQRPISLALLLALLAIFLIPPVRLQIANLRRRPVRPGLSSEE